MLIYVRIYIKVISHSYSEIRDPKREIYKGVNFVLQTMNKYFAVETLFFHVLLRFVIYKKRILLRATF